VSDDLRLIIAYGFVFLGSTILTIGVYGMAWLPDIYTRVHSASKVVFLGLLSFLLAASIAGDGPMVYRSILIGVILLLTTPVASHAIARAAYQSREPMKTPDPYDESGSGVGKGSEA
jgi:multicomponent Na+:H+ antiporter subunit G